MEEPKEKSALEPVSIETTCPWCEQDFKTNKDMLEHRERCSKRPANVRRRFDREFLELVDAEHKCPICGEEYPDMDRETHEKYYCGKGQRVGMAVVKRKDFEMIEMPPNIRKRYKEFLKNIEK